MQAGEFVHMMGDTHVYANHVEPLKQQLLNRPRHFPVRQQPLLLGAAAPLVTLAHTRAGGGGWAVRAGGGQTGLPRLQRRRCGAARCTSHLLLQPTCAAVRCRVCTQVLRINPAKTDIDSFVMEDFELVGYEPHKKIEMKMAV